MSRFLFAFAGACTASAAAAEPQPLDTEGLRKLVPGTLIELDTPLNTVIPIRFTGDGMMTGEANQLASYLGAERDRGRWHITNDRLCLKWFRWFDAEERCLTLKQDDKRIFWQDLTEGKTGTATIIERTEIAAAKPSDPAPEKKPADKTAPEIVAKPAPPKAVAAAMVPATRDAAPAALTPEPAPAAAVAKPDPFAGITIISRAEAATVPSSVEDAAPSGSVEAEEAPPPEPPKAVEPAKMKKAPAPKIAAAKPLPVKAAPGTKVSSLVLTKDQAAKRAALAFEPTYQVANVEEDDVLNIRNGPSEYHAAVGAIPPSGRGVKIVGTCKDLWCPITHGGARGWVNRYYLSSEAPAAGGTRARR